MGRDKALLPWRDSTLLGSTLQLLGSLAPVVDERIIVGERPEYRDYEVPVVPDRYPDAGTLGGIATALAAARHEWVLVVACDMPFLNRDLLTAMLELPRDTDVIVPTVEGARGGQRGRQTFQTLHALYRSSCLAPIEACIAADRLRVISFFDEVRVERIPEAWTRELDPELRSFMNVNRPEELEQARALDEQN